jgi:hypothetical protein
MGGHMAIEDKRAIEIIKMAEDEENKASNFRNLYQDVSNYIYPSENQITTTTAPGRDKSLPILDPTPMYALDDMTAGLIGTWIPSGQNFYGLKTKQRVEDKSDRARRYLSFATEIAHEEMFDSNFLLQLHDTVKALGAFGTGNLYTEWDYDKLGLNYKDWHISTYTIKQNARGFVDTVILTYAMTARQASDEFANPGETILKAVSELKTESKKFDFVHVVRPRINRNVMLVNNLNMPFESIVVNKKEKKVIHESGFEEMPFAVPRWEKSSMEKYGRGRGTIMLSAIKELQQMWQDLMKCAERWNNPPRWELADAVEGELNNSPGARNIFGEREAAGALDGQLNGNFPISKDMIEMQQEIINKGFFKDVFVMLGDLKGDRRTTVEIQARLKEGLRRLVSPVARLEYELFTPIVTRSVLLLMRNGRIPEPPPELQGQELQVEYVGELAMAMRTYQARAFTEFSALLMGMSEKFPEATDILNLDRALPHIGTAFGVRTEDMNTQEEIDAKRAEREQRQQQIEQAALMDVQSQAYKNTQKAPEEDSPAMEAVSA